MRVVPNPHRPAAGVIASYSTGFDITATTGAPVATLSAVARPSAGLLGPGVAALLAQLSTYYSNAKATAVLAALGVTAASTPSPNADGMLQYVTISETVVSYPVLLADVGAQTAALITTLSGGGNVNKGGNN